MVRGEETLGFPAKKFGETSANSIVESWPLAQAYGLDEFKRASSAKAEYNNVTYFWASNLFVFFLHLYQELKLQFLHLKQKAH